MWRRYSLNTLHTPCPLVHGLNKIGRLMPTLVSGIYVKSIIPLSTHIVFDYIEQYAPGFRKLVIDKEVLTPPDLEQIFGLTGGVRSYYLFCYTFSNYTIEYISWGYVIGSTLLSQTNV